MEYIYALVDPRTKEIRYVGRSKSPDRRHLQHKLSKERTPKGAWIEELRSAGIEPQMVILQKLPGKVDVGYYEQWWLTFAKRQDWLPTNAINPSSKKPTFGDMFSSQLRDQYEVFDAALKSSEPLVLITREQFRMFVLILKLLASIIVGLVVGWGAWYMEYTAIKNMPLALLQGLAMGMSMAFFLARVAVQKTKYAWFPLVYASVFFSLSVYLFWTKG